MLKCENIQPQLSAYLDGEMPLWKLQLIQWHLKRCPICAHDVIGMQQTDKILRRLNRVKTSDSFLSDVMQQVSIIAVTEKRRIPWIHRAFRKLESSVAWVRYSFQTRPHPYAVTAVLLVLIGTIVSAIPLSRPLSLSSWPQDVPILAQSRPSDESIIRIEIIPMEDIQKRHLSPDRRSSSRINP
jgi:anti-sigma factor RsiW